MIEFFHSVCCKSGAAAPFFPLDSDPFIPCAAAARAGPQQMIIEYQPTPRSIPKRSAAKGGRHETEKEARKTA